MTTILRQNVHLLRFPYNAKGFLSIAGTFRSLSSKSNDDSSSSSSDSSSDSDNEIVESPKNKGQPRGSLTVEQKQQMNALLQSAKNLKSISRNDPDSLSSSLGTPKTFIRDSAKPVEEQVKMQVQEESSEIITEGLDKRLVEAAKRVAKRMPKHLSQKTEQDLLSSLSKQKAETEQAKAQRPEDFRKSLTFQILQQQRYAKKPPVNDLDYNNKSVVEIVERTERRSRKNSQAAFKKFEHDHEILAPIIEVIPNNRARGSRTDDFLREARDSEPRRSRGDMDEPFKTKNKLFLGEGLNIFPANSTFPNSDLNRNLFWEELKANEDQALKMPRNGFEEMIEWTKDGKLWQYPIDNEQGLDEETEVPFYEHVLLDGLLDEFPDRGPVRQFMELVLMGLSHNPYINVERKHETIAFYKQYFEDHNLLNIPEDVTNEETAATSG